MARPLRNRAVLGLLAVVALAGGCETQETQTGYVLDQYSIDQVRPGVTDRDSVAALLGTPSTETTFGDDRTWYYFSRRTEQFAFFEPDVIDQQVVAVQFDNAGVVADIKRYTMEDGKIIDPVTRITPTRGREMTVLEQLFGNLGRFNNPDQGNPASRRTR